VLMPPACIKPYVKRGKNDAVDAAAICKAMSRPDMRFVAIKGADQQAVLMQHKTRELQVVGSTSVLRHAGKRKGALAEWIAALRARRPERLVAVALASKLARTCSAIVTTGAFFRQEAFARA